MADQTKTRFDDSCKSCQAIQGLISLTNTPRIIETRHWVIEHAHPTAVRGWLVIVLNRHCSALHELTEEEFEELSHLLRLACQALHQVLDTEKEYVMQFAEGEGFNHVHVHVIARLPDWPPELKGPRIFSGLGSQVENPLESMELSPLVEKIGEYITSRLHPSRILT